MLANLMSPCASRRYLPVLRGFPAKFIYDPWNAPESVQAAAKCIIGVHYPKPMVNHAEASRLNIERMKQIYQQLSRYRGLGEAPTPVSHLLSPGEPLSAAARQVVSFLKKCVCVSGLLASVPSTNGNGNGGMMAYSPGEQQPGTNSSGESVRGRCWTAWTCLAVHLTVCLSVSVPAVSGSSVATANGSGSILLNFDSEEQTRPGSGGQQRSAPPQPQQQQGGSSVRRR